MLLRDGIRGVLGFPVTPFHADLSLDLEALARNADEMARYPFCALVAAGGTGEFYSLTPEEVEQVVRGTVEQRPDECRLGRAGADCILILPPYYNNAPFDGMTGYYRAIGSATGVPLMVHGRDWAGRATRANTSASCMRWGDRLAWLGGLGDDFVPAYFGIGVQAYTSSISNIAPRVSNDLAEAGTARDLADLRVILEVYAPLRHVRPASSHIHRI
jgi:5-dehydro-4-deoxyglucarate dehydratase